MGDKVILHKDRIPGSQSWFHARLIKLYGVAWEQLHGDVVGISRGQVVLTLADGDAAYIKFDWVTKVEEPKEIKKKFIPYRGIIGSAEWSESDSVHHGKLLNYESGEKIRDLVTYEARTAVGLKYSFRSAVDDYLKDLEEEKHAKEVTKEDPNKEMVEADTYSIPAIPVDPETDKFVSDLINNARTPMDAQEKIGRALTKTAGFPEKLGCYEHIKGNLDEF